MEGLVKCWVVSFCCCNIIVNQSTVTWRMIKETQAKILHTEWRKVMVFLETCWTIFYRPYMPNDIMHIMLQVVTCMTDRSLWIVFNCYIIWNKVWSFINLVIYVTAALMYIIACRRLTTGLAVLTILSVNRQHTNSNNLIGPIYAFICLQKKCSPYHTVWLGTHVCYEKQWQILKENWKNLSNCIRR